MSWNKDMLYRYCFFNFAVGYAIRMGRIKMRGNTSWWIAENIKLRTLEVWNFRGADFHNNHYPVLEKVGRDCKQANEHQKLTHRKTNIQKLNEVQAAEDYKVKIWKGFAASDTKMGLEEVLQIVPNLSQRWAAIRGGAGARMSLE